MSKILFWVGVILLLLLVSRLLARHKARQSQRRASTASRRPVSPPRTQAMVRCVHCGVHLPASESLQQRGQAFCSADHARLGAR